MAVISAQIIVQGEVCAFIQTISQPMHIIQRFVCISSTIVSCFHVMSSCFSNVRHKRLLMLLSVLLSISQSSTEIVWLFFFFWYGVRTCTQRESSDDRFMGLGLFPDSKVIAKNKNI